MTSLAFEVVLDRLNAVLRSVDQLGRRLAAVEERMPTSPGWLTTTQATAVYRVSRSWLYHHKVPRRRVGRRTEWAVAGIEDATRRGTVT